MRYWMITICLAIPIAAQQPAKFIIDGKLTDPGWRDLTAQQLAPSQPGGPGGDIRVVVAGRYLYVAARLPEPSGRFTARLTGRNPSWEEEDALRILAGANIGYTDRIMQVNPLGAYSIEKAVHVSYSNVSVMPYSDEWERQVVNQNAGRFLAASVVDDKEWDVEVAIPLNELSAPGSDRIFVSVERIRAARPGSPQQRWHWPEHGPAAKVPFLRAVTWDAAPPLFRPPLIGNQEPPIEVGRRAKLPPIDSRWTDAAWRDVPAFHLLRDEHGAHAPRFATEVKLTHDGHTLAVIARCAEPADVVARVKENDGPVNLDDSFHVYLATSGSAYAQFVVNPAGYLLDNVGFTGGPRLSRAREWNSGASVRARREEGAWIVRMDLPLEATALMLGETQMPTAWRILLLRSRPGRDGEPATTSVLPVIESETPLCPARYRRLNLVEREPSSLPSVEAVAPPSFETRVLSDAQRKQMDLAGMLERQMKDRTLKILEAEKHDRDQLKTRADWERFRDPKLKALADFIGPFPARTALQARVTKEFPAEGYRRQDLIYQSRPGMWVTANLYLPAAPHGPMPGIVIIHSLHRPRTQAELQDMGILWARAGCAVLIMDQIGHGERMQTYPWNREGYQSRYVMGMQLYLAGESLIKWMVWDVTRGVDLLLDRSDIDRNRIILLGAVAGGGDPAAVTAALDSRIAAVVPFNFGEATPRNGSEGGRWPRDLADPGWGSWESTRNMPGSIVGQFFPWLIDASVAPRHFVYSFEMGWDVERQPAWERYQKVFGFYDAGDHLAEAHGFGAFPGPGECANIGPAQRRTLYPTFQRWYGIPAPSSEPDDRRPEDELASLTPGIAARLGMRSLHDLAREVGVAKLEAARAEVERLVPQARRKWFQAKLKTKLGDIEPNPNPEATSHWSKPWRGATVEGITLQVEPGIVVPLLLLRPSTAGAARTAVVVAVAEGGKEGFFEYRAGEIKALVKSGVAVCLPDLRGTGETAPEFRRGPAAAEISLAATELMLGNTLLGARLKDLRTVVAYLAGRPEIDAQRMAVWGDSFTPVNAQQGLLDETLGFRIGPMIQHQAEPLGGALAILGALYEDRLRAVAVRGGLVSYLSIFNDAFAYVPEDVVVPGILEVGDLSDIAAALAPRPLMLEGLVDAKNRLEPEPALRSAFAQVFDSYRGEPNQLVVRRDRGTSGLSEWLAAKLRR